MSDAEAPRHPIDTYELIAAMVEQLASVAWQKMGLQPDLFTGTIEKDLESAKTAVDGAAALAELLKPKLEDADRTQLLNLVRDLKVNYVQKLSEA